MSDPFSFEAISAAVGLPIEEEEEVDGSGVE